MIAQGIRAPQLHGAGAPDRRKVGLARTQSESRRANPRVERDTARWPSPDAVHGVSERSLTDVAPTPSNLVSRMARYHQYSRPPDPLIHSAKRAD
jgi:hypothetical protein